MVLKQGEGGQGEIELYSKGDSRTLVLYGSTDLENQNKQEAFEFTLSPTGRIPDDYLFMALKLSFGNVTRAAKMIDVDRSIFYHRCLQVEGFREQMNEIREIKLDFAEDLFFDHVREGSLPALQFFLRTQGKDRGYTTQTELVGSKDNPVNISINVGGDEDYG